MHWSDFARFVRRRRVLVVVAVLLAAAAAVLTGMRIPPSYTAQGEVLLLPPKPVVGPNGNPYLSLSGLTPLSDVVATSLSSPGRVKELEGAGATAEYLVSRDLNSPAPLLVVDVTGNTASETMQTLDLVMSRVPDELAEVQRAASVPGSAYVTMTEVTRSVEPERSLKGPIRATIVVTGGALVLLLGAVFVYDIVRRTRPDAAPDRNADEDATGEPDGSHDDVVSSGTDPWAQRALSTPERSPGGSESATVRGPGHEPSAVEDEHVGSRAWAVAGRRRVRSGPKRR